jgi:hypothetical protein
MAAPLRSLVSGLLAWMGGGLLAILLLLQPAAPAMAAMDYAKQVLIGADFHDGDLRGVTFNLTNLRDANLSGADMRNASLLARPITWPTSSPA